MRLLKIAALVVCFAAASFAQKWEYGADAGVGLLNNVNVTGSPGSATAGFANGFVAGAFAGENLYRSLSGEIRYEFMQSDLRLSSGGQSAQFTGLAHAIHYDFVFHRAISHSPVQVFAAAGGGIKYFLGTGKEEAYQPLSQFGYFTKTSSVKPMFTGAAGLSFALGPRLRLRAEVRDYLTAFPTAVLTPPPGVKYGKLLNDLVPMVSLVFTK